MTRWHCLGALVSIFVLGACGSSDSTNEGQPARDAAGGDPPDGTSPGAPDGGLPEGGSPGASDGASSEGGRDGGAGDTGSAEAAPEGGGELEASAPDATDASAPLTCSGTWLDQDTWDTCPELSGAGPNCNCYNYAPDGGTLVADYGLDTTFDVTTFLLPTPMTAGQPYSLSVTVTNHNFYGDIELWGTNTTCGPGLERLYVAPVASQIFCADVIPSESYAYALLVQRLYWDGGAPASGSAYDFLACPTDRCP